MPGDAKTTQVLLSTATLMVGPSANVMSLNPATHSIGLVKNVRVQTDMGFTDLTQGINNTIIMSVQTKFDAKIMAEVFEYTANNLAYAAGLDGSTFTTPTAASYSLVTAISAGGTSVVLSTGAGTDFSPGDYVILQDTLVTDRLFVGKVLSKSTDTLTLDTAYSIPVGMTFATATTIVYRANGIKAGTNSFQPTFGAKLVGILPSSGEPITLVFPKIKITKGLDLAFETNNFSNMAFEFTPYVPVVGDPYYADFAGKLYTVFKR
jgi:hypothetical protein